MKTIILFVPVNGEASRFSYWIILHSSLLIQTVIIKLCFDNILKTYSLQERYAFEFEYKVVLQVRNDYNSNR